MQTEVCVGGGGVNKTFFFMLAWTQRSYDWQISWVYEKLQTVEIRHYVQKDTDHVQT